VREGEAPLLQRRRLVGVEGGARQAKAATLPRVGKKGGGEEDVMRDLCYDSKSSQLAVVQSDAHLPYWSTSTSQLDSGEIEDVHGGGGRGGKSKREVDKNKEEGGGESMASTLIVNEREERGEGGDDSERMSERPPQPPSPLSASVTLRMTPSPLNEGEDRDGKSERREREDEDDDRVDISRIPPLYIDKVRGEEGEEGEGGEGEGMVTSPFSGDYQVHSAFPCRPRILRLKNSKMSSDLTALGAKKEYFHGMAVRTLDPTPSAIEEELQVLSQRGGKGGGGRRSISPRSPPRGRNATSRSPSSPTSLPSPTYYSQQPTPPSHHNEKKGGGTGGRRVQSARLRPTSTPASITPAMPLLYALEPEVTPFSTAIFPTSNRVQRPLSAFVTSGTRSARSGGGGGGRGGGERRGWSTARTRGGGTVSVMSGRQSIDVPSTSQLQNGGGGAGARTMSAVPTFQNGERGERYEVRSRGGRGEGGRRTVSGYYPTSTSSTASTPLSTRSALPYPTSSASSQGRGGREGGGGKLEKAVEDNLKAATKRIFGSSTGSPWLIGKGFRGGAIGGGGRMSSNGHLSSRDHHALTREAEVRMQAWQRENEDLAKLAGSVGVRNAGKVPHAPSSPRQVGGGGEKRRARSNMHASPQQQQQQRSYQAGRNKKGPVQALPFSDNDIPAFILSQYQPVSRSLSSH